MLKTLHTFIAKELTKVTALALVAFTVVMTVFAVIEPLRKGGLAADQVVALFGYMLPVMLSLTLPIAALFATTIVYGRFSQDNELLACRASGISTISLLKPALVLGAAVTAFSLLLSNYITPRMAQKGEIAVKANFPGIIQNELKTQGYFKIGRHLIHAEQVEQTSPDKLSLSGVVYADMGKPSDITIVVAPTAYVKFNTYGAYTYATVNIENSSYSRSAENRIYQEAYQGFSSELPILNRNKAAFYDWDHLLAMLEQPLRHQDVVKQLGLIRQAIVHDMFANDVIKTINAGLPYMKLRDRLGTYEIRAAWAAIGQGQEVVLSSTSLGGRIQPVEVTVVRDGSPQRMVVKAANGVVQASWSAEVNASLVGIELSDKQGVTVSLPEERQSQPQPGDKRAAGSTTTPATTAPTLRRDKWTAVNLAMPPDIGGLDSVNDDALCKDAQRFTSNVDILKSVNDLQTRVLGGIIGDFTAEMHARVAYSVSCFLLVGMGAALGLIYRGGQVVSAFAISIAPAAVVIVMVIMGKELVSNPGVQLRYGMLPGLVAIWSGIVSLAVATVVIYWRLLRR